MAKENVKKFYEEISKNKELQEKFIAAQEGYQAEGKSKDQIFEDIVLPVAKEAGFEFTMSEYQKAHRDVMAENGISEEELENVSGGKACCFCFFIGAGWGAGGCIGYGHVTDYSENSDSFAAGLGAQACAVVGLAIGFEIG